MPWKNKEKLYQTIWILKTDVKRIKKLKKSSAKAVKEALDALEIVQNMDK